MTHYYYDSKAKKFYGPLDEGKWEPFPPCHKHEWANWYHYLSGLSSHPHTFTGHSRVVPEGEIVWRYEVKLRDKWEEFSKEGYEQATQSYPKRRVATPKITGGPELPNLSASTANLSQIKDKDEWLKDVRGESTGYSSTSGEEVNPSNRNWWCHSCKREVKDEEVTEGITHKECGQPVQYLNAQIFGLTAQPDKQVEDDFFKVFGKWTVETFSDAGSVEHFRKLEKEAKEAAEDHTNIVEHADCLLCLYAATYKGGFSLDELLKAAKEKFEVVKKREWVKLPDGTYQHKK